MSVLDLYYRLPTPLQNAAVSTYGLYARRARFGHRFRAYVEEAA